VALLAEADERRLDVQLRVAEYNSVRAEWLSSRDAQQHTLQWTLAAVAVLLVGLLGSAHVRSEAPFLYVALAGAGVVLATCSQGIWFGEVMRMERAALYLRGIEEVLAASTRAGMLPPLLWESWRGRPKLAKARDDEGEERPWTSKASISIVASFGLYGLLSIAPLTVLIYGAVTTQLPLADRHLAVWVAGVTGGLFLVANAYMCAEALKIRADSSKAAVLTTLSDLLKGPRSS
jgi:hypothetical protein